MLLFTTDEEFAVVQLENGEIRGVSCSYSLQLLELYLESGVFTCCGTETKEMRVYIPANLRKLIFNLV